MEQKIRNLLKGRVYALTWIISFEEMRNESLMVYDFYCLVYSLNMPELHTAYSYSNTFSLKEGTNSSIYGT